MNMPELSELSVHFNGMTFILYAFYLKKKKKSWHSCSTSRGSKVLMIGEWSLDLDFKSPQVLLMCSLG